MHLERKIAAFKSRLQLIKFRFSGEMNFQTKNGLPATIYARCDIKINAFAEDNLIVSYQEPLDHSCICVMIMVNVAGEKIGIVYYSSISAEDALGRIKNFTVDRFGDVYFLWYKGVAYRPNTAMAKILQFAIDQSLAPKLATLIK